MQIVVIAGAGLRNQAGGGEKAIETCKQALFEAGIADVADQCRVFLDRLVDPRGTPDSADEGDSGNG